MTARLQSEDGKACYAKRKQTVEPVFGQIKDGRGARRFLRRGLRACEAEWKLLCGTHNLLKTVAALGHASSSHVDHRLSCNP
jgi:Transposase DDE domain